MVGLLKALLIAGRETQWQHLVMRFPSSTTSQNSRVKGTLFIQRSFGLKRKLTRGCERVRVSEIRVSGMSDKGLWRTGN